jgi:hypothetical protein
MRRLVQSILIFGALGAGLSVVAAWGLVMIEQPGRAAGALNRVERRETVISPQGWRRGAWRSESFSESQWFFSTDYGPVERDDDIPAWVGDPFWGSDDDLALHRAQRVATTTWMAHGWPLRCVRHVSAIEHGGYQGRDLIPPLRTFSRSEILVRMGPIACSLGYDPIWPGLLVNTAFYGAILWGLWVGPGALRRGLRRRRGACVRCGYDLRGGEGSDGAPAVCPECGAGETRRIGG